VYESDRSIIPVTMLSLDDLALLVMTLRETSDMDGNVLIQLTRLYWPRD
jgi:restriction system protein